MDARNFNFGDDAPQKPKDIKDLGWANGWGREDPKVVQSCKKASYKGEKHDMEYRSLGRCVTEVTCRTCGYKYRVDSSD